MTRGTVGSSRLGVHLLVGRFFFYTRFENLFFFFLNVRREAPEKRRFKDPVRPTVARAPAQATDRS